MKSIRVFSGRSVWVAVLSVMAVEGCNAILGNELREYNAGSGGTAGTIEARAGGAGGAGAGEAGAGEAGAGRAGAPHRWPVYGVRHRGWASELLARRERGGRWGGGGAGLDDYRWARGLARREPCRQWGKLRHGWWTRYAPQAAGGANRSRTHVHERD